MTADAVERSQPASGEFEIPCNEANEELAQVWCNLVRGVRAAATQVEGALKREHRLSIPEFEALCCIYGAQDKKMPTSALAQWLLYSSGSTTKLVDQHLVKRSSTHDDRRVTLLTLTPRGDALLQAARQTQTVIAYPIMVSAVDPRHRRDLLAFTRRLLEQTQTNELCLHPLQGQRDNSRCCKSEDLTSRLNFLASPRDGHIHAHRQPLVAVARRRHSGSYSRQIDEVDFESLESAVRGGGPRL